MHRHSQVKVNNVKLKTKSYTYEYPASILIGITFNNVRSE